jgi:hypothetical protein
VSIKFNCTTVYGDPIEIQTPLIDELVAIVNGEKASDRRPLAVEILKYVSQRQTDAQSLPELDRAANQMLINIRIGSLWNGDEHLVTVKSSGIERLEIDKSEPEDFTAPTKAASEPEPTEVEPEQEPEEPMTGEDKLRKAKEEVKGLL